MMNVQYIKIPFVSAFNIYPYIDAAGLTIGFSGSYITLPYADDNYERYPTGFIQFVSGSGFWQGSGYSTLNVNVFSENFDSYPTGLYTGFLAFTFLSGSVTQTGYASTIGLTTGYCADINFHGFWTGAYYFSDDFQAYLTGSGYNTFFPKGTTTISITTFTGYSGTNYYFTSTSSTFSTGLTIGYCYITGGGPAIYSGLDYPGWRVLYGTSYTAI